MSGRSVVIVGAGVAGVAAAWSLRRRGLTPRLVSAGPSATAMTSGALDRSPWTHGEQAEPSDDALAFLGALGFQAAGGHVATAEGIVRRTTVVGPRVLRLDDFAGATIGVVDFGRADFSGVRLAQALNDSPWSRQTRTHFIPISTPDIVDVAESKYPLAAFTHLFDQDEKVNGLPNRLRGVDATISAFLTGPWLGVGASLVESQGCQVGETLSPPDGAFGRRFQRILDDFLAGGFDVKTAKVSRVASDGEQVRVDVEAGESSERSSLWADSVLIATGGIIGGGVMVSAVQERPRELAPALGMEGGMVGGARDGWDACADGGRWVVPPHWISDSSGTPSVHWVGDARGENSPDAPAGTILGAVESALRAVDSLVVD